MSSSIEFLNLFTLSSIKSSHIVKYQSSVIQLYFHMEIRNPYVNSLGGPKFCIVVKKKNLCGNHCIININIFHGKQKCAVVKEGKTDGSVFLATEHLITQNINDHFSESSSHKTLVAKNIQGNRTKYILESLGSTYLSVAQLTKTKQDISFEIQIIVTATLAIKQVLVTSQ